MRKRRSALLQSLKFKYLSRLLAAHDYYALDSTSLNCLIGGLMKGEVVIRQAEASNLSEVKFLLQEMKLPIAGLENHVEHLFILESGSRVLGAVGFEAYPPYALLRSLVVAP